MYGFVFLDSCFSRHFVDGMEKKILCQSDEVFHELTIFFFV